MPGGVFVRDARRTPANRSRADRRRGLPARHRARFVTAIVADYDLTQTWLVMGYVLVALILLNAVVYQQASGLGRMVVDPRLRRSSRCEAAADRAGVVAP